MNERIKELVVQAKFMAEETINKQISKNAELDAFTEKFAELVVHHCVGITEMFRPRNGHNSAENVILDRVEESVHKYFDIEPQNINDLWKNSAAFREYFGANE